MCSKDNYRQRISYLNELYKSTVINFDNYFKYSGEIELSVPLYKFESYNTMKSPFKTNRRCHDIHTIMLKKNM